MGRWKPPVQQDINGERHNLNHRFALNHVCTAQGDDNVQGTLPEHQPLGGKAPENRNVERVENRDMKS